MENTVSSILRQYSGRAEVYGISEDAGWLVRRTDWFPLAPTCVCLHFRCKCIVTAFSFLLCMLLAAQIIQLNCWPLSSFHGYITYYGDHLKLSCVHLWLRIRSLLVFSTETALKARAYSSGNTASEGKEINDHFSPKWLISPILQCCRNIFKLESCQLKQSTFLPAGYANVKIDALCIKMLMHLDVTERKELH